ncbi:aminotransferase class V-fold PLP-dependent enzyme [Epibacterium sp. SM1979]|uniref:Aminotransferase class V-fold PLP-dependent enzyme n=1 Tax=Tritonibacter litoralis TaxID=2662264 RepID=A0A843Y9G0_9RHOB|nr:aminotransferase class V-fold PLP-dependent enzyme [Tritonibacter litoralis]MQQ07890.1 aminotransferase class V-fold PLP-dependent enzyme [Tritonibacter litoralis]
MTDFTSLAAGRPYLAIPGPSVVPDAVLRAMHHPSSNIYEGELVDMVPGLVDDLKRVARTAHHAAIYICNGHGLWEASLSNVTQAGDRVLVASNGRFGAGWADTARALGLGVSVVDSGMAQPWDLARLRAELLADTAHEIKAVLAVHVDTSGSIRNDVPVLRALLDEVGHPALLMVDCIASMGCETFEMDAWGVDVSITASQKGLMMPPGLGFVFFNDKAAARRSELERVSPYWDWRARSKPDVFYQYFCGTAPVQQLYGLRAALDMIHAEGIENVWNRHALLARAIWAAVEAWGQGGAMTLEVKDPAQRSHAVTALSLEAPDGTRLRKWCEEHLGLTLGIGLRATPWGHPEWDAHFRFGHMGHVSGQMILGLLGGVQAALTACDIAHGSGAVEAAAQVLAQKV